MKLNDNIRDYLQNSIKDNESTFKTIELIEAGVFAPYEVLEALK